MPGDAGGGRVTGLGRLGHYVGDRHPRRDAGRDAGYRLRDPAVGARAPPQRVQAVEVDEEGLIRLRRLRVRLRPDRHTAGPVPAVDVHKARRVLVIIVERPRRVVAGEVGIPDREVDRGAQFERDRRGPAFLHFNLRDCEGLRRDRRHQKRPHQGRDQPDPDKQHSETVHDHILP